MDEKPLPPMDEAFAAVLDARGVDQVELNRIQSLADSAAKHLDVQELGRLRVRVDAISTRNRTHFGVMSVVRRVRNHITRQEKAVGQTLKGMGL